MSKDAQKELLEYLDGQIAFVEALDLNRTNAIMKALRRLAEKFYGEWREKADLILTLKDTTFLDGFIKSCNLMRDIRDFDPMKEK